VRSHCPLAISSPTALYAVPAPTCTYLPLFPFALSRCLDRLLQYNPDLQQFPIVVSQDCGHAETAAVIRSYADRGVQHMEVREWG
jgi:hypothetical protein